MAQKPVLRRAVAKSKIKAVDYNYNFEQLGNYIENSIADNALSGYQPDREFNKGSWVLAEVNGENAIYESMQDQNKGNSLTDETYWKKVELGGSGYKMFDVVQKDHILTFEKSKGLVAFGDYAYKTGSEGTRYGYPEFYNTCLKEYNESEDVTLYTTRNFEVIDTSTNTEFALSENLDNITFNSSIGSFSTIRYVLSDNPITSLETNKPFVVTFTTGADVTAEQAIVSYTLDYNGFLLRLEGGKLHFWGSTVGTKWDLAEKTGVTTLVAHTTYTVYVNWDGANYTVDLQPEGGTRTTEITVASTSPLVVNSAQLCLGLNYVNTSLPFRGRIHFVKDNEVATYITDKWKPYNEISVKHHANEHVYYDIADVDDIDYLYDKFSEAWLYGVDTTNERIRTPRDDYYSMSPSDIANVYTRNGQSVDLDTVQMMSYYAMTTGGLVTGSNNGTVYPGIDGGGNIDRIGNDDTGSHSSYSMGHSLYVKSTDVIKKKSNHYLYICVGNTETEVASTEVTEVTTTENDTLPLGFSDYFVVKPSHPSWLKSSRQFYNASVYETMYNWLINNIATSTNIKDINENYTDYDYVVDGVNMKFRLPLKSGKENTYTTKVGYGEDISYCGEEITSYVSYSYVATTDGLITSSGLLREGGEFVLRIKENNGDLKYDMPFIYGETGEYITGSVPVKAGETYEIQAQNCLPYVTYTPIETEVIINDVKADLYFKVGNAVANQELIDVGTLTEVVNNKIDINSGYVDGQWVAKCVSLVSTAGTQTQYKMDLSEYLPKDEYDYTVKFRLNAYDNDSPYAYYLDTDVWTTLVTPNTNPTTFADPAHIHGGEYSRQNTAIIDLPVGSERYVALTGSGADEIDVMALGFRRLGKNQ